MRAADLVSRGWSGRLVFAIAALAVTAVGAGHADARMPRGAMVPTNLDVQPFPGTPDASPQTDIGFPALAPRQIEALTVIGARSGSHAGRLTALPGANGTAFWPSQPFSPGERVTVTAALSSPAAGTACGASGATRIRFTFTVAVPASIGGAIAARVASAPQSSPPPGVINWQTRSFRSENWLHPPVLRVSGRDSDPGSGDIFADVENSVQSGPLILGPQGQLIYFQPLQRSAAFNVEVQSYQGQTVMTYWQGYVQQGVGIGRDVILDHHYQRVAAVYAGHGYSSDLHEFLITPQGDAFLTAFVPVRADLSSVGGPRHGTLLDSVIQEVDIATGQVLWEWHASGHVSMSATHARPVSNQPFDFFHVNSIQQLPGDRLLISARQTWALYEIDMRTGRMPLVIGGKHSSLKIGPRANFEWQHDARMQPDGTITLFDNADDKLSRIEPQSRALRIRLDLKRHRVTLVRRYTNNPPQLAASQGDVQLLPDGNTFVGWGAAPYLSEFGRSGREFFSIRFPEPVQSYRGLRFTWWGQPATPPSIATARTATGTRVYASWNGATDVAGWQVLAGLSPIRLTAVGHFPKSAQFETAMWLANTAPYIAVQALDQAGQILGTSATVRR